MSVKTPAEEVREMFQDISPMVVVVVDPFSGKGREKAGRNGRHPGFPPCRRLALPRLRGVESLVPQPVLQVQREAHRGGCPLARCA